MKNSFFFIPPKVLPCILKFFTIKNSLKKGFRHAKELETPDYNPDLGQIDYQFGLNK